MLQKNKDVEFQIKMSSVVKMKHDVWKGEGVEMVKSCLALISSEGDTGKGDGDNPLHAAMKNSNHREVRQLLLGKDIDITNVTSDGYTALHMAASNGNAEAIPLIANDSRMTSKLMNTKNRYGYTALMLAVGKGHLDCVKELTKLEGVDWETKNHRGESLEDVAR